MNYTIQVDRLYVITTLAPIVEIFNPDIDSDNLTLYLGEALAALFSELVSGKIDFDVVNYNVDDWSFVATKAEQLARLIREKIV